MKTLSYIHLSDVDPVELIDLLNAPVIRKHLIAHETFDREMIQTWVDEKMAIDSSDGCRVRAIKLNGKVIGWCGIQFVAGKYELAVILSDKYWGHGRQVFRALMQWAKELSHSEVVVRLLHTRREYMFLTRIAKKVYKEELYGDKFTTYLLSVDE